MQRLQLKRSKLLSQIQVCAPIFRHLPSPTTQVVQCKRREALEELALNKTRFEAMRAELQGMREAQRASVLMVAGWQPRAVQRRFDQEVAMDPVPAEARVRQITQELEDVRQHIRGLTRRASDLQREVERLQRESKQVHTQHEQMHELMQFTLRLLDQQ